MLGNFAGTINKFPCLPTVYAQAPEARIINIFRVDGYDARMSRGIGGREIEPRAGQRLSEGNILSTGWDTQVYLQMDESSILKMDESTRLQIAAARSLLSLTVQSGSALIEVADQSPGHLLETRIGNTGIGVRGTMYIISRRDTDVVTITMLLGLGEVSMSGEDGITVYIPLPAGYVMWIFDVFEYDMLDDERKIIIEQTYRIRRIGGNSEQGINMDGFGVHVDDMHGIGVDEMDLFVLEEIINRQEYLIVAGIVTPEMFEAATRRIEELRAERETARAAYTYAEGEEETVRILLPELVPTVTVPRTPQDDTMYVVNGRNQDRDFVGGVHMFNVEISAVNFVGLQTTGASLFIEFTLSGGNAGLNHSYEVAFRSDGSLDGVSSTNAGRATGLSGTVIEFIAADGFRVGSLNSTIGMDWAVEWDLDSLDAFHGPNTSRRTILVPLDGLLDAYNDENPFHPVILEAAGSIIAQFHAVVRTRDARLSVRIIEATPMGFLPKRTILSDVPLVWYDYTLSLAAAYPESCCSACPLHCRL